MPDLAASLIEKIRAMPPERVAEIEDFVDFLALRGQQRALAHAASETSAASFAAIWNNPNDSIYDAA
jgi:hypothetical protein